MNWLAHLFLTPKTPQGFLGALLGDVVRGPLPSRATPLQEGAPHDDLDAALCDAITLHRRIDSLTATHPMFRQSCARIDPVHGHYRRVLVDVFYDYVLAHTWSQWSTEPLAVFLARVHGTLDGLHALMPEAMPPFYAPMRAQGWLASYAEVDGIALALRRMRSRLRRDHPLEDSVRDLVAHRDGFVTDFRAFFPEAIALAQASG